MADQHSATKHGDDEKAGVSVMIAVDGSVYSDHAVAWYIRHLHRDDNRIVLLHVANPDMQPVYAIQGMAIPREEWEMMVNDFKEKVHDIRHKYIDRLEKAHITKVKFIHKNGSPGSTVVQAAADEHCNLIVVGTRGLGTVRRTILGSVSDYILHHSTIPVAVCRGA